MFAAPRDPSGDGSEGRAAKRRRAAAASAGAAAVGGRLPPAQVGIVAFQFVDGILRVCMVTTREGKCGFPQGGGDGEPIAQAVRRVWNEKTGIPFQRLRFLHGSRFAAGTMSVSGAALRMCRARMSYAGPRSSRLAVLAWLSPRLGGLSTARLRCESAARSVIAGGRALTSRAR